LPLDNGLRALVELSGTFVTFHSGKTRKGLTDPSRLASIRVSKPLKNGSALKRENNPWPMESMYCRHRKFTPECLSARRRARVEKIQLRSRNKLQNGIAQIEAATAATAAADYVPRIKLGSLDYFQKS
jgi:hypothetical protein